MNRSKIVIATSGIVLAIAGAFATKASTKAATTYYYQEGEACYTTTSLCNNNSTTAKCIQNTPVGLRTIYTSVTGTPGEQFSSCLHTLKTSSGQ